MIVGDQLSLWQRLITWDLTVIHRVQHFMYNHPRLQQEVDKVISPNPFNDIALLNWVIFLGVMASNAFTKRWYSFLWCCSINLAVCALSRLFFQARRPFEIDSRLKPMTNRTRSNYGFPSIESHMAVVVNGFVAARFAEWWMSIPLFALTLVIGFTRVYSCARFVHQIALSYATGGIGLSLALKFSIMYPMKNLHWQVHFLYLFCCVFVLIAVASLTIESGSYLGGIPREEYIRVVGGILNTDPSDIHEHLSLQSSKTLERMTLSGASERAKQKKAQELYKRKDSFFHMQNTLAKKDREKKALVAQIRGDKLRQRRQMAKEAQDLGLTEYERWQQQLEYSDNDFTKALAGASLH
jgi:hypothetical protein